MNHLDKLENQSIFLLREAYYHFKSLCMLWSIGKDSTVLLWLTRKAFFGHVPFSLVHIDTGYKIPAMIAYRDQLTREWGLDMIVGMNTSALSEHRTFPDGNATRMQCCQTLKTEALVNTINGTWPRRRWNPNRGTYEADAACRPFHGVIVGLRADEEGSRSKERYFSARDQGSYWDVAAQPPEFWNQYKTDFAPETHVRIHPLLEWTELNIWEYIERESIPVVSLYFDQSALGLPGKRYRSLGCLPCTLPIASAASTVTEVVAELRTGSLAHIAERAGREQDKEDGGGLEDLRKGGYM
jgi:sulfate adenylyltransferase subunit 2